MNISVNKPKRKTRIVDAIQYKNRIYTADDLDEIFRDLALYRDFYIGIKHDFEVIRGTA